ncbi:AAA family ATPase [Bradyrhizobium sp. Ai1a-2]|uniref:AAA family ATPase n=1 Tax=Bradyrhizobium sp. Ai1a-2 TaxID=196490 RepID=UPI000428CAB1|nr:AAA family ATPase [Bradyrhizobium sp. Ai1a-2]
MKEYIVEDDARDTPSIVPDAPQPINATPWVWRDPATIPPRELLYSRHYIRKFVSAGFGAPGGGKSSRRMVETLAMTSCRALLGIEPVKKLRVWYWNGEDPSEETDRRFAAACLHYGIKPDEIDGYLFADSGRSTPIVIAQQAKTGTMIATPVVDELKKAIRDRGIDVMILDPFVSCHRVAENDNPAIDAVVKKLAEIADETGCSINLEHHIRKTNGNEATVDDGRGASSLVGAARSIEVLNKMTPAEAEKLGIDHHWRYFSVDDGKANMSPLGERKWFKLASVSLGNRTDLYPEGDSVGVVTTWKPPNHLDGVTGADFDNAAREIRPGNWKENIQAKDWVGKPIAKALKLNLTVKADKAKVRGLIDAWVKAGSLVVVEEKDPERRERKKFVRVTADE